MRKFFFLLCILSFVACERKWTDKDKSDFYSGCLSGATSNKDVKDPKSYCNCLLQKVVAKYPNAGDAKYIKYDSTVKQLAKDCLKQ
jgi:hypothetical protein